ncbi:MAG: ATP-binding cassette domain-containing protein, partial [Anaerolineales bacterium]|nr:ATP-binding cassette domain-containing protein [Anaerolineales bacterium]
MTLSNESILIVNNLSAVFPDGSSGLHALYNISFEVPAEQFVCVLGPSACGKSTLLRIISGLLSPTEGEIIFNKTIVNEPQP